MTSPFCKWDCTHLILVGSSSSGMFSCVHQTQKTRACKTVDSTPSGSMTMGGSAMDTTCTPVNPSGNKGPDGSEAVDMGPVGDCLLLHGFTRATTQKIVSEMGEHSRSLKDFKDMVANLPLKMAKEAFDLNVVETAFWARLAASQDPTKAPSSTQETRPPSPSTTVPLAT